jgi:DNA-binding transcriptional MerR regulator
MPSPTTPSPRWGSTSIAARILKTSEATIRRWANAGRLQSIRTASGNRIFDLDRLERMVVEKAKGGEAQ